MKRVSELSLTDLAFEGRNKEYGAYNLRKRYPFVLLFSLVAGILVLVMLVAGPFLYYIFEPVPLLEGDFLYEMEYVRLDTPSDDELDELARAVKVPLQEITQAPVVSDSIQPEEEKKVEEPPEKKPEEIASSSDTTGKPGGSGLGEGEGNDSGLVTSVDVMPRFPGGDEARLYFLRQHIRYPQDALNRKIQGVVMITFIVELDGSLSRIEAVSHLGGGCEEEAIRVIRSMPKWEPAKRQARAVRVMVRMPIVFRIPGR